MEPSKGLPIGAVRIWRYIRYNILKPDELPEPYVSKNANDLRFGEKCPMGLCCYATEDVPEDETHFCFPPDYEEQWTLLEIQAYASWWDSLTDPEEAVKMQWG